MQSRTCSNFAEPKPSFAKHLKMLCKDTKFFCVLQVFPPKTNVLTLHFRVIIVFSWNTWMGGIMGEMTGEIWEG
jgi:hypothetical protein